MENEEKYMKIAFKEAEKAYKKLEIPVGAVIVHEGKVIAKAHNTRDESNIVINHAEISAIIKANKKMKNWRLNECVLYSTLEPCDMCKEVIKNSKIKYVVYATEADENQVKHKQIFFKKIESTELNRKSKEIIKEAFKNIRKKAK